MKQTELLTLEHRISAERFAPYRAAAVSDLRRAISLYEKNAELSAAFWIVLCDVEILVRNAMHDKLTAWSAARYGRPTWYLDHGGVFNEQTISDIDKARHHLAANGRPETSGRVVFRTPPWLLAVSALRSLRTLAMAAQPARRLPRDPGARDAPGRA
jgi:hypothetical protein